ncbi:uncharacterized protein [Montipora foliosa]
MWDTTIGHRPGFHLWDDSTAVRNLFLSEEGGKTKVPTHQSYNEWDCTALFQATIFAKSFSMHHTTLSDLYVKPRAIPHGSFHGSVLSPVGDNAETFALAIDQLRRLRNTVCHSSRLEMDKATFDQNIQYAKEAFKALGILTASIDAIGSLTASDFPTTEVRKLEEQVKEENQAYIKCLESRNADMEEIRDFLTAIKQNVQILAANKEEVARLEQMIEDWKTELKECNLAAETRVAEHMTSAVEDLRVKLEETASKEDITALGNEIRELKKRQEERDSEAEKTDIKPTVARSCLPSMVPKFTGRQSECQEIVDLVSSQNTRLVTIWGSPGFGKTSVAIAVGHQLHSRGFPVCFLSLRGLQTKGDLTSKLFSLVRQPTASPRSVSQALSFENELLETLGSISDSFVLILDNVDDILESGFPNVKEDVLQLFEEILTRNEKITLVVTTRESFEFVNLNFPGHKSIRIRPLDDTSSRALAHELVPNASRDDCAKIAQICGCVPLAIKLMCSLVCEDDVQLSQCLIEFTESAKEGIVNILDNPDFPANQRLQFLYEKSFHRLSPAEKEAFVSLSVLPGCFTMELASAVLNVTGLIEAKKMLQRLRRKSLLDSNSECGTLTMHQLLQSFAKETGQQGMKEIIANAKCRIHAYFISRFDKLNDEFLRGHSMDAFVGFYEEKQLFIESLVDGCTDPRIAENVFKVLIKAEMFLDSLFSCSIESQNFNNIYDSALKAANSLGKTHYQSRLLASKAFGQITWGAEGSAMQFLKKAYEIQSKSSSSVSNDERSKYKCYFGICELVIGEDESGIQCLQDALCLMRETGEQKILRLVVYQVMVVYYQFLKDPSTSTYYYNKARKEYNSAEDEQLIVIPPLACKGKEPNNVKKLQINTCIADNWPMQFLVIFHVSKAAKNFFDTDTKQFVINRALRILNDLHINSNLSGFYLLQFCAKLLALLRSTFTKEEEDHTATADIYHLIGMKQHLLGDFISALQYAKRALDVRQKLFGEDHASTADSYHLLGITQHSLGDFNSALQSKQRALDLRIKLFGEEHATTANIYHSIGVIQHSLGDFIAALQSKKRALDLRIKQFGEDHESTADSYDSLWVTQHSLGHFTAALQSAQRALDVRKKLFGEDHASTANSYHSLGVIQHSLGDFTSALQSKQQALDSRIKQFGEDQASTANSYHSLGVTQHSLGDFTSALQSKQRALDVRIKLFGEDHASTAGSYDSVGVTQHSLGDFTAALQSAQRALDVRKKLFGEDHASTADSYHSLGVTQHSLGDFTAALQSKQRALDVRIKLFGEDHASTADSYDSLGVTQHSLGDFTAALQFKQRALDVRKKLFGEDHASTADTYHSLGVTQHSLGDFTAALQSKQRALDVRIKLFAEDHASTADSYDSLGVTQHSLGDFTAALQSAQRALDVRKKLFGEHHASTADSYHSLGVTQHSLGDFTAALPNAQRALDVRKKLFGEDHASTADSYHSLAVTQHSLGDFTAALQSAQRTLDVRKKMFREDHASTADSYDSLGVTQHSLGDFTSALQSKQRALDVRIKLFGEDHASTADSYHSPGVTQHSLGDFTSALQSKQRALDVRIKLFGEDHASTAGSYDSVGVTQHSLGDFTSALQSKQRALDVRIKLFGEDHASTADSYHSLGVTQHSLGDFTAALQSKQRALDVRIKLFGEDHASTADSYHSLGVTQHSLGDFTSALQSKQRALDVRIKLFGEDHASTADSYHSLGATQHLLGDFTAALQSKQRALDVRIKLFGEDHASTAGSYDSVGVTQHSLGDFTSALQSKQRALDVRIKLFGEDHASTADSYHSLGVTQHSLGDFTAALQSAQRALDVRKKLFGEDHASTADSYHSLGVIQHSLGDFSLRVTQHSLSLFLFLFFFSGVFLSCAFFYYYF